MSKMKAEMVTLKRSALARITGRKYAGEMLGIRAEIERPYMGVPTIPDTNGNEYWIMEKQFWLKYKREFQNLGFVPLDTYNRAKQIPS